MSEQQYKHIDLGYLYEIADSDIDFVKEMINDYVEKIPSQFDELVAFAHEGNFEKTGFIAHKLKSSFQFMGAQELIDLAAAIEKLSKDGSGEPVMEKLTVMKGTIADVLKELQHKLASIL